MNLEKISKKHEVIHYFRDLLKNNKTSNIIVTDDINILSLAIKNNLKILNLLICDEKEYQKNTSILIDDCIIKAQKAYAISELVFSSLKQKENSIDIVSTIELNIQSLYDFKNKHYLLVF